MVDLAQVPGRTTAADRLTNNRTTVLPSQREDHVPAVQLTANMANAQRGSDVDQVRRALGIFDDAVGALVDINVAKHGESEKKNAQLAAQDQAIGKPNDQLMKRSDAYRMVIADGRVNQTLAQLTIQARQNVSDALAQHADADPTKGEHPFGLDDANQLVEQLFRGALVDPDGKPIDYGDPAANAKLYRGLAQVREDVMAKAADIIKQQEQTKALRSLSVSVGADAANGVVSVEENIARAKALGIDPTVARGEFMKQIMATAELTENPEIIQKAAGSQREDGTPTWSAQERATLLEFYHTKRDYFEAKHDKEARDRSATNIGEAMVQVQSGHLRVTPDYVQTLIDTHQIRAEDAHQLFAVQEHQDELARQKVMQARQDQEFRWAQASNARSAAQFAWSQQEHAFTLRRQQAITQSEALMARAYSSGMGPGQALAQLNAAYAARKIDDSTYNAAREMARGIPDDGDMIAKYGAASHFLKLKEALDNTMTNASRHKPGYFTPQGAQEIVNRATVTFYDTLRQGKGRDEALRRAYHTLNIHNDRFIQQQVLSADADSRTTAGAKATVATLAH